jgi:hypothetical protein
MMAFGKIYYRSLEKGCREGSLVVYLEKRVVHIAQVDGRNYIVPFEAIEEIAIEKD